MGMYTELVLSVDLKHDRPDWVDRTLRYMNGDRSHYPNDWVGWQDHALFRTERWAWCLGGGAVYMPHAFEIGEYDRFTLACSVKNYDDEYGLFLNWLRPHLSDRTAFIGWTRYEEEDDPTLLYLIEGEIQRTVSPVLENWWSARG